MSIRITQCNVAPTVTFFKKGIMDRYNFSEYTDINEPTFFFWGTVCEKYTVNK
jgi:hypothetical protein